MYDDIVCNIPEGRCSDHTYRLAVYEAGHALTARALGLKLISVKMLPRPPVLTSDKAFANNDWGAFVEMLENRIIELFGGQIAEQHCCGTNTCCSGDIARIDELAKLVAGLSGAEDSEAVMFELEDAAIEIFADQKYRDAIVPIAEFLFHRAETGREVIDGPDIEAELDKHVPVAERKTWLKRVFSFG
ncbi:MAG: hypothetical protein L3J36_05860 [Rhodobacteraceae bacterium]|nr:hypothetical protein [Paracoccaceae bacterium]